MEDIRSTVMQVVAEIGKTEAAALSERTSLAEDLKLKSVDRISISAILSTKLGVEINMFEILKVKTISDLLHLAKSKVG